MSPIELGIDFDELEKISRPKPIPNGEYEFIVDARADESTTSEGRPMWIFYLKVMNRPDIGDRSVRYPCLLPWRNPATGQMDYTNCFALVDLINGTQMIIQGKQIPDKEAFFGRTGVMNVTQKPRKGEEDVVDNVARIATKRRKSNVS